MSLSVLSLALNNLNAIDTLERATVYHVCKVAQNKWQWWLPGRIYTLAQERLIMYCVGLLIKQVYILLLGCLQIRYPGGAVRNITDN